MLPAMIQSSTSSHNIIATADDDARSFRGQNGYLDGNSKHSQQQYYSQSQTNSPHAPNFPGTIQVSNNNNNHNHNNKNIVTRNRGSSHASGISNHHKGQKSQGVTFTPKNQHSQYSQYSQYNNNGKVSRSPSASPREDGNNGNQYNNNTNNQNHNGYTFSNLSNIVNDEDDYGAAAGANGNGFLSPRSPNNNNNNNHNNSGGNSHQRAKSSFHSLRQQSHPIGATSIRKTPSNNNNNNNNQHSKSPRGNNNGGGKMKAPNNNGLKQRSLQDTRQKSSQLPQTALQNISQSHDSFQNGYSNNDHGLVEPMLSNNNGHHSSGAAGAHGGHGGHHGRNRHGGAGGGGHHKRNASSKSATIGVDISKASHKITSNHYNMNNQNNNNTNNHSSNHHHRGSKHHHNKTHGRHNRSKTRNKDITGNNGGHTHGDTGMGPPPQLMKGTKSLNVAFLDTMEDTGYDSGNTGVSHKSHRSTKSALPPRGKIPMKPMKSMNDAFGDDYKDAPSNSNNNNNNNNSNGIHSSSNNRHRKAAQLGGGYSSHAQGVKENEHHRDDKYELEMTAKMGAGVTINNIEIRDKQRFLEMEKQKLKREKKQFEYYKAQTMQQLKVVDYEVKQKLKQAEMREKVYHEAHNKMQYTNPRTADIIAKQLNMEKVHLMKKDFDQQQRDVRKMYENVYKLFDQIRDETMKLETLESQIKKQSNHMKGLMAQRNKQEVLFLNKINEMKHETLYLPWIVNVAAANNNNNGGNTSHGSNSSTKESSNSVDNRTHDDELNSFKPSVSAQDILDQIMVDSEALEREKAEWEDIRYKLQSKNLLHTAIENEEKLLKNLKEELNDTRIQDKEFKYELLKQIEKEAKYKKTDIRNQLLQLKKREIEVECKRLLLDDELRFVENEKKILVMKENHLQTQQLEIERKKQLIDSKLAALDEDTMIQDMRTLIDNKNTKIETLKEEIVEKTNEISIQKEEIESSKIKVTQLQSNLVETLQENERKNEEKIQSIVSKLTSDIQNAQTESNELQSKIQEIESEYKQQNQDNMNQIITQLQGEIEQVSLAKTEISNKYHDLEKKYNKLNSQISNFETKLNQYDDMLELNKEITNENLTLKQTLEGLQSDIIELKEYNEHLDSTNSTLQSENDSLKNENIHLNAQLQEFINVNSGNVDAKDIINKNKGNSDLLSMTKFGDLFSHAKRLTDFNFDAANENDDFLKSLEMNTNFNANGASGDTDDDNMSEFDDNASMFEYENAFNKIAKEMETPGGLFSLMNTPGGGDTPQ